MKLLEKASFQMEVNKYENIVMLKELKGTRHSLAG